MTTEITDAFERTVLAKTGVSTAARKRRLRKENREGLLMAVSPFVGYVLFGLFPMVLSLIVSFTELKSYDLGRMKFVGFANYKTVFTSQMFYRSVVNTLYYCLSVPINLVSSLFIANLLTKPLKAKRPARVILFLPSVCSSVGVALMWTWIYEANYGVINTALAAMGLPKVGFMTTKEWFMPSVLFLSLWMNGTNIVLMQAALANVDASLKEAARIDGATERTVFWKVTFPQITPTLFYILTMNLIAAMQEMAIMQVIATNGVGPDYRAVTLTYYLYRMAFTNTATEGLGLGSALSWIVAVAIIIITRVNFKLSEKWVSYD